MCAACGGPAPRGVPLCRDCLAQMPWLGPCCPRCALPLPCAAPCPAARRAFAAAWAPLAHRGPARRLVMALKFRGAPAVADVMAAQIAARLPAHLAEDATLVPIPADPWRRRRRGLDHAALLTARLAARLDLPSLPALRRAPGPRQAAASREERTKPERVPVHVRGPVPWTVLLVDDVHTTGATLHVCGQALLEGGATEVRALTYARTLPSAQPGRNVQTPRRAPA